MSNQQGYTYIAIFGIIMTALISFLIGTKINNLILSQNTQSDFAKDNQYSSTPSATKSEKTSNVKQKQSSNLEKPTTTTTTDTKTITISGKYMIGDFDKVTYTLTFPKAGGALTGSFNGACVGEITGEITPPDSNNESKVTGTASGSCTPVPRFSFKTPLKSSFEGLIYFSSKKIKIIHDTTQPFPLRGSFELPF